MQVKIAASILSSDFGELNKEIKSVEPYVDIIHVDVMDGHFVPNLTFGLPILQDIKTKKMIECHLMVLNPDNYLDDYAKAGAKRLIVHQEACPHLHRTIQHIKSLGCRAAVALNPATPLPVLEDIIDDVDMVLLMTVNPGFSGQDFIPGVLSKVMYLRELKADLDIEVDGGINAKTGRLCRGAGANVLVSASYIFDSRDRKKAIALLKK